MPPQMSHIANQAAIEDARVGFHAAFMSQLESGEPDPVAGIAREMPSGNAVESIKFMGGVPGLREWKGDRRLHDRQAYKIDIVNRDWEDGISVHQNNIKDDTLGLFADDVADMVKACRTHRYDLMVDTLTNGFDGANSDIGNGLCFDDGFFFDTAHPLGNGRTQSNKLTVALTSAGLTSARKLLREMRSVDGSRLLNLKGTHLIVGPKNEELAEKLMMSDILPSTAGTASETNTQKNKYKVVVSPRLVDDFEDDWYLADLNAAHRPLIFCKRQEIETTDMAGPDSLPKFQRGELWFGAEARYAVAYYVYMTIVGSRP